MLIFTLRARQLITRAINEYGDDGQRRLWRTWASAHPAARRGPVDPWDDGTGPMPSDLTNAIQSALDQMFDAMMHRLHSANLSEDEAADLQNDLSYIRSVAKSLSLQPMPAGARQ